VTSTATIEVREVIIGHLRNVDAQSHRRG